MQSVVAGRLDRVPGLGARAPQIASSLTDGRFSAAPAGVPARQRPAAASAGRPAFAAGLKPHPAGGAGIALVSGGLSLVLIRSRDFVPGTQE